MMKLALGALLGGLLLATTPVSAAPPVTNIEVKPAVENVHYRSYRHSHYRPYRYYGYRNYRPYRYGYYGHRRHYAPGFSYIGPGYRYW